MFALFASCRNPVTWSEQSRSPDGTWIANAHTVEYSGFGTGAVETIVEIRRLSGSKSPERVLAFADGGRDLKLRMQWDGRAHFSGVYDADTQLLYYQVVRASGVDIAVR